MSESTPMQPIDAIKATPLDQAVIDATGIGTVEELDALKALPAALADVQAQLDAKQAELDNTVAAKDAELAKANAQVPELLQAAGIAGIATSEQLAKVTATLKETNAQQVRDQLEEFRRFTLQWLNDGNSGTLADAWKAAGGG